MCELKDTFLHAFTYIHTSMCQLWNSLLHTFTYIHTLMCVCVYVCARAAFTHLPLCLSAESYLFAAVDERSMFVE